MWEKIKFWFKVGTTLALSVMMGLGVSAFLSPWPSFVLGLTAGQVIWLLSKPDGQFAGDRKKTGDGAVLRLVGLTTLHGLALAFVPWAKSTAPLLAVSALLMLYNIREGAATLSLVTSYYKGGREVTVRDVGAIEAQVRTVTLLTAVADLGVILAFFLIDA